MEFEKWFYTFFKSIEDDNFLKDLHNEIILGKKSGWVSKEKSNSKFDKYAWFIDAKYNSWENNKDKLKGVVLKFLDKNYTISISKGDAPLLFDELKDSEEYLNEYGQYDTQRFPLFTVHLRKDFRTINYLGFLKTKSGYKLIEIN